MSDNKSRTKPGQSTIASVNARAEAEARNALWNPGITPDGEGVNPAYLQVLLEQYRIYVESAEHTSQRRIQTNVFFLTLSTGLIAATTSFFLIGPSGKGGAILFTVTGGFGILLCVFWALIICSYRRINRGKFQVIGELETRLPASPFSKAEWALIRPREESGKNAYSYRPVSELEGAVPLAMMVIFAALLVFGVVAGDSGQSPIRELFPGRVEAEPKVEGSDGPEERPAGGSDDDGRET